MTVSYRPETPDDASFVRRLVIDTIVEELAAQAWPEAMREQLLDLQYRARRAGLQSAGGDHSSQIIVADGQDAGWILSADFEREIRICQVVVVSSRRRQGVASATIDAILTRAAAEGKPVRLTVNCTNGGAIRLYERLGFMTAGSDAVQQEMEWTPSAAPRADREETPR